MFSCSAMSESNCCECWDKFDSANFVQTFEMSWTSAIWAYTNDYYNKTKFLIITSTSFRKDQGSPHLFQGTTRAGERNETWWTAQSFSKTNTYLLE